MAYNLNASNAVTPILEFYPHDDRNGLLGIEPRSTAQTKMKSIRDRLASRSSRIGVSSGNVTGNATAKPSSEPSSTDAETRETDKDKPGGGWFAQLPTMPPMPAMPTLPTMPFFGTKPSEESIPAVISVGEIFPESVSIPPVSENRQPGNGSSSAGPSTGRRKRFTPPQALSLNKTNFESKRRVQPGRADVKTRQAASEDKRRKENARYEERKREGTNAADSKARPKVKAKRPRSAWKEALRSPTVNSSTRSREKHSEMDRIKRGETDLARDRRRERDVGRGGRDDIDGVRDRERDRRAMDHRPARRQREDSTMSDMSTNSRTRLRPPRKPSREQAHRQVSSLSSEVDWEEQLAMVPPPFNPGFSFGQMAPTGVAFPGAYGLPATDAMDPDEEDGTTTAGSTLRRILDGLILFLPLASSVVLLSLSCLPQTWWRARLSIAHIQLRNVTLDGFGSSTSQARSLGKRSEASGVVASFGVWGWCVVDVSEKSSSLCLDATYGYTAKNLVALLAPQLGSSNFKTSMFSTGLIRAFLANVVAAGSAAFALSGAGTYLFKHCVQGDEHAEAGMIQHGLIGVAALTTVIAWILDMVFVKQTGGKLPSGTSMDGGSITTLTFISACLLTLAAIVSFLPNLFAFWKRQHGYAKDQMWGEVEVGGAIRGEDESLADEDPNGGRKRKKSKARRGDEDWSPPVDWDVDNGRDQQRNRRPRDDGEDWSSKDIPTSDPPRPGRSRQASRTKNVVVPNGYRLTRLGGGGKGRNAANRVSTWFEDHSHRKGSKASNRDRNASRGQPRGGPPPVPAMPMGMGMNLAMPGMAAAGVGMGMMPGMGMGMAMPGMQMAAPMGMPDGRGGYWMYQGPGGMQGAQ